MFDKVYRHGSRGGAGCMAPGPLQPRKNEVDGGGGFTLWISLVISFGNRSNAYSSYSSLWMISRACPAGHVELPQANHQKREFDHARSGECEHVPETPQG